MNTVKARYLLLPLLYLCIGGIVTAMLVQRILHFADTLWLILLVPMVMTTVLLTVVGIVNVWLSYRSWSDAGLLRQYSHRSLLWLYLRGWAVVMAGLTLGVTYAWMHDLLPDYIQSLLADLDLLFYGVCVFLTLAALTSIVQGENLQEIRLRNAQSENQLLKAQLNPHFLYNTLNNIDALIWLDQERASTAVTSLSDLMRYMTYSSRQESVTLAEEVTAIEKLCRLQRLRMAHAEALQLVTPVPEALTQLRIAPLMLVPLVENCFKHCGATDETGAIVIRLEMREEGFAFTTDNSMKSNDDAGKNKKTPHGVGLAVLRRRLELLYSGRYRFEARQDREGRFRTSLTIDC